MSSTCLVETAQTEDQENFVDEVIMSYSGKAQPIEGNMAARLLHLYKRDLDVSRSLWT